ARARAALRRWGPAGPGRASPPSGGPSPAASKGLQAGLDVLGHFLMAGVVGQPALGRRRPRHPAARNAPCFAVASSRSLRGTRKPSAWLAWHSPSCPPPL